MESAHELYQVTDRMIDWSESSHRKVEIHASTRINVRAAPSVCRKATLCVHVSGVCQCKCVSLYVCVCVVLPLSIRRGWALLLKGGHSGPPIQLDALGRSNVLSALMLSRCPFSWEKERGGEGGGEGGSWSTLKQTGLVSGLWFVSCCWQRVLLLMHLQFCSLWLTPHHFPPKKHLYSKHST